MGIQILDFNGNRLEVSKQVKSDLEKISREMNKSGSTWKDISDKILLALIDDGFTPGLLLPEIEYYDSKKGKKIVNIKVYYTNK